MAASSLLCSPALVLCRSGTTSSGSVRLKKDLSIGQWGSPQPSQPSPSSRCQLAHCFATLSV